MREVILEAMSFKDIIGASEKGRKDRAQYVRTSSQPNPRNMRGIVKTTDVTNPKTLEVTSVDDGDIWTFKYKSKKEHSTTGKPWHGIIQFLKNDVSNNENAEDLECKIHCDCLSGDSLVLMGDGCYKPIKDIKINDDVYTHRGRIRKVTNTIKKPVTNSDLMYKIKVCGFPHEMIVTGDHPFYTLRGNDNCICGCNTPIWEAAFSHECSSPDLILQSKYAKGHYRGIRGVPLEDRCGGIFEWIPAKKLRLHEWVLSPWIENTINTECDPDFARLVGYYIAEGCIPKRGREVKLTFNINEYDTLGADIIYICNKFKYKVDLFKSKHGNWFDISIKDRSFRTFCDENIGRGSLTKKISSIVMNWNNEAIKNVFIGALLGDGWIDPKNGMKYVSINFNLISQISTILNKLKIRNTISILNKNTNSETRHPTFQVVIPRGPEAETIRECIFPYLREKDKFESSMIDLRSKRHSRTEGCLRSIRSYEKIQYDGFVYDITVDEDESFIAHGIAVHNCPDYYYRMEYNNAHADIGLWSKNKGSRQPPKLRSEKGVGKEHFGACKHIIALADYLKTQIQPTAPEPGDEPIEPTLKKQPKSTSSTKAPEPTDKPIDTYSDSRSGGTYSDSRTELQEANVSNLYKQFDQFVKSNQEFEVPYD